MTKRLLTLVLLITTGIFTSHYSVAGDTAITPVFAGSKDDVKKSLDNNAVSFTISTASGFNAADFAKKAEVYAKMFSMTSSEANGEMTYTVKFNDGFQSMKYILRLFAAAEIKEVLFEGQKMETEKFFSLFY